MNNLPLDHSTLLRLDNLRAGITQSEITTWDSCPEKWYLGYNHLLRKAGTYAMYFIYGDGVHSTLEHWYKTGELKVATLQFPKDVWPDMQMDDELRKAQALLQVQMERYVQYYESDLEYLHIHAVEDVFDIEFEGVKLMGKVDLEFSGIEGLEGFIVADHKTGSRFDTKGWQFRFQFMFYAWMAQRRNPKRPLDWFMVNGIKKPALRQGKAESFESYIERVRADHINEPEKYFLREHLPIQDQLAHFEKRVLMPKINRIKLLTEGEPSAILIESLVRQQNTEHCVKFGGNQACQFLDICKNGWEKEGFAFSQRDSKHEELDVEE